MNIRAPAIGQIGGSTFRDLGWPPITSAEQRAVTRLLYAQGRDEVDEALLSKRSFASAKSWTGRSAKPLPYRRNRALTPGKTTAESKRDTLKDIDARGLRGDARTSGEKHGR